MHAPSFLVGSVVTGSGFLLIHRELSKRERLTTKWLLREKMEEEVMKMWNHAKESVSINDYKPKSTNFQQAINTWNDNLEHIRKYLSK